MAWRVLLALFLLAVGARHALRVVAPGAAVSAAGSRCIGHSRLYYRGDPWGRPWQMETPLRSSGPNGVNEGGGGDDLIVGPVGPGLAILWSLPEWLLPLTWLATWWLAALEPLYRWPRRHPALELALIPGLALLMTVAVTLALALRSWLLGGEEPLDPRLIDALARPVALPWPSWARLLPSLFAACCLTALVVRRWTLSTAGEGGAIPAGETGRSPDPPGDARPEPGHAPG